MVRRGSGRGRGHDRGRGGVRGRPGASSQPSDQVEEEDDSRTAVVAAQSSHSAAETMPRTTSAQREEGGQETSRDSLLVTQRSGSGEVAKDTQESIQGLREAQTMRRAKKLKRGNAPRSRQNQSSSISSDPDFTQVARSSLSARRTQIQDEMARQRIKLRELRVEAEVLRTARDIVERKILQRERNRWAKVLGSEGREEGD